MGSNRVHRVTKRERSGELQGRELSAAVLTFHEAVARKLGISGTEWKCLDLLARNGAITAKHLAEMSGLTTGAITGIVDRLEETGYVRREDNPHDRRSVIIKPLPRKDLVEALSPIFQSLGLAMSKLSEGYSKKELTVIGDFQRKTVQILREQTAKLKREGERQTESEDYG
jgi:DNA-binding MarR family transcriptional regulator